MYLVVNKSDGKTIVWSNSHPYNNLSPNEVWSEYDILLHNIIFIDSFDFETQKVVNYKVVNKTQKEIYKDKYTNNLISGNDYKDLLIEETQKEIYSKFDAVLESGILYNSYTFQANETSCNRIVNAISKANITGVITPVWIASDNSVYVIQDFQDLKNLGIAIGNCFEINFGKRTTLRDAVLGLTISELENYNVDHKWDQL